MDWFPRIIAEEVLKSFTELGRELSTYNSRIIMYWMLCYLINSKTQSLSVRAKEG